MVKFDIDKKGYDIEQVENYINTLSLKYEEKLAEQKDRVFTMRNELDVLKNRLEAYQNKDKQISQALYFAVEKAEQIENSARKLYDLEIKRVNILYERWRVLIDQLEQSYGGKSIDPQISKMMDELKNGLDSVMAQNNNIANSNIKQELKENSDNYIKNLLNKMDYVINDKPKKKAEPKETKKKEEEKPSIGNRLKVLSSKLDGKSAENYLNDEREMESNAYSKSFFGAKQAVVSDSGFNLEEALNPKEDLEEIMKAFDFFNNGNNGEK